MRATVFMVIILSIASLASARTWRVNTAGTGDAPTLHAAMDSAAAGDIVLVEAGHYDIADPLGVPEGVRLVGESGPAHTIISRIVIGSATPSVVSLLVGASMHGIHVRGRTLPPIIFSHGANFFQDCILESLGPTLVQCLGSTEFNHCLLLGGAIAHPVSFVACIIATPLRAGVAGSTFFVNDVIGDVDPAVQIPVENGNFFLDPEFCGVSGSGNYFLKSTSPCLPENNPFGVPALVGPLPQGCGTVAVEERTWGGVKALYRDQ
jgi:hypothetical protein